MDKNNNNKIIYCIVSTILIFLLQIIQVVKN